MGKILFFIILLLSMAARHPAADAVESNVNIVNFYVVCNCIFTALTCIFCFVLVYKLTYKTKNIACFTKLWLCVFVIVVTPAIHSLEQFYRVIKFPVSSGILFTLLEGVKELFSSSALVCFTVLVELQLEEANHGKMDLKILENKKFQLHLPFNLFQPIEYVATEDRLHLMRFFCYLPIPATIIIYVLRAIFEQSYGFLKSYGFLFQVLHFVSSSLGEMAIYSFSQGVEANSNGLNSSMSKRISILKLYICLIWVQGPGLELLHAIQDFVLATMLLCWAIKQIWAFSDFSLMGKGSTTFSI